MAQWYATKIPELLSEHHICHSVAIVGGIILKFLQELSDVTQIRLNNRSENGKLQQKSFLVDGTNSILKGLLTNLWKK